MLRTLVRRAAAALARPSLVPEAGPAGVRPPTNGAMLRGFRSHGGGGMNDDGPEYTRRHGTTVLCVRKGNQVVIIADGQCTSGAMVVKPNVRKVRKLGSDKIGGFAGATADAFTLFEKLESSLEAHSGQLTRAAVELAKSWRTDKYLRQLNAVMVVADSEISLEVTGGGDVIEPHDGIIAIGSGGPYALAAARALIDIPGLDAEAIARKAMKIAADACIYTNHNFTIEIIASKIAAPGEPSTLDHLLAPPFKTPQP